MSLLLDTHALLWWFTDDPRLPAEVRDTIADETRPIYVSAVSALEIAVKHRLGKLDARKGVGVNKMLKCGSAVGELHAAQTPILLARCSVPRDPART